MAKIWGDAGLPMSPMSFGKSFDRMNGQPLDKSAVITDKTFAAAYAKAEIFAASDNAYVGMILSVSDGFTTKYYGVANVQGDLEEVGSNIELDDTLKLKGKAADAWAVGQAIEKLSWEFSEGNSSNVGKATQEGGEIFNDYANNQAFSPYTNARGTALISSVDGLEVYAGTIAGSHGYRTLATSWNSTAKNGTITLDDGSEDFEGNRARDHYVLGDIICFDGSKHYYNDLTISSISVSTVFTDCTVLTVEPVEGSTIANLKRNSTEEGKLGVYDSASDEWVDDGLEDWVYCMTKPMAGLSGMFSKGASASGEGAIAIGRAAQSLGRETRAIGNYAVAEGRNTEAHYAAHAEGVHTKAYGRNSHSEGSTTQALGENAHAEGRYTQAIGENTHAEGRDTIAEGNNSHAEGSSTQTLKPNGHAEGLGTIASGSEQHVQGRYNVSEYDKAHIVGNGYVDDAGEIVRKNAHTLDWSGNAWFAGSVFVGALDSNGNVYQHNKLITSQYLQSRLDSYRVCAGRAEDSTLGDCATAEGYGVTASGQYSHAEGEGTTASGSHGSHAEGGGTTASGARAHAEGSSTIAEGKAAHAEGSSTHAYGNNSHAEGYNTAADGTNSHAEGKATVATGVQAHAEGYCAYAYGDNSHAEGVGATAAISITGAANATTYTLSKANSSIAAGSIIEYNGLYRRIISYDKAALTIKLSSTLSATALNKAQAKFISNIAFGSGSHTEGSSTTAIGDYSHAEGIGTISYRMGQHVQGKYNIVGTDNDKYIHIVGNGTVGQRSNAHTLDESGNAWYAGDVSATSGDKTISLVEIEQSLVGKKTSYCGEIFGDYENNQAWSEYSTAKGIQTSAGIRGYKVADVQDVESEGDLLYVTITISDSHMDIADRAQSKYAVGDTIHYVGYNGTPYEVVIGAITQDDSGNSVIQSDGPVQISFDDEEEDAKYYWVCSPDNPSYGDVSTSLFSQVAYAEGVSTCARGYASHSEGESSKAIGFVSHAEGSGTEARGYGSHAEGLNTKARGYASHAEGLGTEALGYASHAEGQSCIAEGSSSHAEGSGSEATGTCSHAEGDSKATKYCAHAEGCGTQADGHSSHSEGWFTEAIGDHSHAEGRGTIAHYCQHVEGQYNVEDTGHWDKHNPVCQGIFAHIVGNGQSETSRSNAYTLDWDGNGWYAGHVEANAILLRSSSTNSTKIFKLTVDDSGELSIVEYNK